MTDEARVPAIVRRGANLHVRAGSRFQLDVHVDVAPLRLAAIGLMVASILLAIVPIIRASTHGRAKVEKARRKGGV